MKKSIIVLLTIFCLATSDICTFGASPLKSQTIRKSKRRKKNLARYFNLDMKADVVDEVVDVTAEGVADTTDSDNADTGMPQETDEAAFEVKKQDVSAAANKESDQEKNTISSVGLDDNLSNFLTMGDEEAAETLEGAENKKNQDEKSSSTDIASGGLFDLSHEAQVAGDDVGVKEEVSFDAANLENGENKKQEESLQDIQESEGKGEDESYLPSDKPQVHRRKMSSPVDTGQDYLEDVGFDLKRKKQDAVDLVFRAQQFLKMNTVEESMRIFTHTKDFIKGDLYIFVYDQDGVCLANPNSPESLWKNMYDKQNSYGLYPVREIIKEGNQGDGWLDYISDGATMLTYVKKVMKDGRAYYLSCGFYTHSKHDAVVGLVQSAVAFFNTTKKQGLPINTAFAAFTYPTGNFIEGDLYLYVMRFDGQLVSHGANADFVGTNGIEYKEESGRYINQEIIEKLKRSSEGIWIDYHSNNALKKLYAEMVTDNKKNDYFIACGYYPDADREEAVDLVRKMYSYMKSNGVNLALQEVNRRSKAFKYGPLYIEVYDEDGLCVANGDNPSLVKASANKLLSGFGLYYYQEIINKGKAGGGWINYEHKKLFRSLYVESISMATKEYYIACGLYPVSKRDTMTLLVKGAVGHLEEKDTYQALRDFVKPKTLFRRGDLEVFVLDVDGICLAYGKEYDLIWRNLLNVSDDNGIRLFKRMINTAKNGAGFEKFTLSGAEKILYIEPVTKGSKKFVVGSGYYL